MPELTVRKPNVDLSRGFARHWLGGDAYRTQLFNALSMAFPIGEQLFIDSVRAAPPEMLPDALRAEVSAFIGQEASHRFMHIEYNRQLGLQGLEYIRERSVARRVRLLERLDVRSRLAVTCAVEHFTAILADGVLANPRWMADATPDMRLLWSWHAVEETEHKAVAFDVYKAVGGGYWRRVLWYVHVTCLFTFDTTIQTAHNLYRDGHLFKARTWLSGLRTWFGRDGVAWHMLVPALRYLSPSFHPWQHDNLALGERWLRENDGAVRVIRRQKTQVDAP